MTATTAVTDRPTRGHRRRSGWGIASVVVALACVPWLLDAYAIGQLNRIGALSLMAVSVAILTGTAGLPSVGQSAPFAVGAYTTYRLAEAGIVVGPVQVVVSAVVAMAFSAVVGVFVVRVRGVVFLMVTLAVGVLTAEAAGQWRAVTGGTDGTGRFNPSLPFWGGQPLVADGDVYLYVLTVVVVVLLATSALVRSTPGLLLRGIRDSELRMRASGHRVHGYLLAAYVGTGALAGIGGSLFATTQRFVSPADVGFLAAAFVLIAVLVGGAHSILGAVLGIGIVTAVRFWIAPEGHSELWLGVLLMVTMYVMPDGLVGKAGTVRRRLADSPWQQRLRRLLSRSVHLPDRTAS